MPDEEMGAKIEKKGKGDPNCAWCHGAGEIMHGEMIACPKCTKKGREEYGWMVQQEAK